MSLEDSAASIALTAHWRRDFPSVSETAKKILVSRCGSLNSLSFAYSRRAFAVYDVYLSPCPTSAWMTHVLSHLSYASLCLKFSR